MRKTLAFFMALCLVLMGQPPGLACQDCTPYIIIPGDVDGDFRVTIADAQLIVAHLCGQVQLTLPEQAAADCNHNGQVDIGDAVYIANIIQQDYG